MEKETFKLVQELPQDSTGYEHVRMEASVTRFIVNFVYRDENTRTDRQGKIVFDDVSAFRFCDEFQVDIPDVVNSESVYEVMGSEWKTALQITEPPDIDGVSGKKHYVVWFSDNGYLEVICGRLDVQVEQ
jgi:hypothetical protein